MGSLNNATEESTYVVTVAFRDESGASVIPTAVTWTLTNEIGTVINSRDDVVATPASSINIVLTGDDLSVGENGVKRILVVSATYNSTYGTGLSLKAAATFDIENLVAV